MKSLCKKNATVLLSTAASQPRSHLLRQGKIGVVQLHLGPSPILQQAQINQHPHRGYAFGAVIGDFVQPAPIARTSRSAWNYREGAC